MLFLSIIKQTAAVQPVIDRLNNMIVIFLLFAFYKSCCNLQPAQGEMASMCSIKKRFTTTKHKEKENQKGTSVRSAFHSFLESKILEPIGSKEMASIPKE